MPQPKEIPTMRGNLLMGVMGDFNADSLRFLEKAATYGDIVKLKFGPFDVFFLNHPDYIHDLLVTNAKNVEKSITIKRSLADVSGENLFTSDGEFWKKQRKLMQPAFHAKRIGAYADVMVDYARRELASWSDKAEIDVDVAMTRTTMNVITKTMFDTEVGDETREVGEAFSRLLLIVNERAGRLFDLPHWMPTPENREIHKLVDQLKAIIQRFIDERKATGADTGDLLSMLLAAQDDDGKHMTDEQVINEMLTIFGAGHETTSYTLTFAWYALSQNPDVREKLHQEVDSVLGGRAATLADLEHLPYTDMVIKETLRLYPAAWGFSRGVIADMQIGDYTIPRGSSVMGAPWTLGRDARWFPHPQVFDPERFNAANEPNIPRYAYIPFGGGPRVCIGNQFAMMEARLILATIAQQYELQLKPGFATAPVRAFTLRPSNGMKMIAHSREAVLAY
jgi:cytochrome P450